MTRRLHVYLRDLPLKGKITLVVLVICLSNLVLACTVFLVFQVHHFRQTLAGEIDALAGVVAGYAVAPITFEDPKSAREVLVTLRTRPEILGAEIRLADGRAFASLGHAEKPREGEPWPPQRGARYEGDRLSVWSPIEFRGEDLGWLKLEASTQAQVQQLYAVYGAVAGMVVLGALLLAFGLGRWLQGFITGPILRLAATARQVGETKNYALRAAETAQDEAGLLVAAFNQMLDEIQREMHRREAAEAETVKAQRRLVESRLAGMAEVATSVLHNVGNVLNSVNVSASLVAESLRKSKLANLAKVVRMMEEHRDDLGRFLAEDPKGSQVLSYLSRLTEYLVEERGRMQAEVDAVGRHVEHIKEIVAMQQNYARAGGVTENLSLVDLVNDALCLNEDALARHEIMVERQFSEIPTFPVDKHRILQILINLIRNAKQAMKEGGDGHKRLTVSVGLNGGDRAKITVADNGVGIPPENLTRIFSHGFTTRKDGHGFGLHHSALAAAEMGGSLTAQSEGPGRGAAFTLELPVSSVPSQS